MAFCEQCGKELKEDPSGFDGFWNLYPKKADKIVAFRAWKKLRAVDRIAIMDDLPRRIPTWNLNGASAGEFRPSPPNPSTYLNKRRWEDAFETTNGGPPKADSLERLKQEQAVIQAELSRLTPEQARANIAVLKGFTKGIGR